jgi:alkanesulfonate monooxygenase SsuD/methylene tetrahydromethanopterin reductase-like flavin-dependent oxidoreductase (luciferase family)
LRDGVSGLHFGLILPNYGALLDVDGLAAVTMAAEEVGFDSAWATDHVLVPAEHAPLYGNIAEALVTLGFLAARTSRIALGVSALVVPQRNPFVTLKQLATLDFLTGGRVLTAIAAGWMEGEFRTLGADFARRGHRTNEWIELAQAAFAEGGGALTHAGELELEDAWLEPPLVRPGGPELWVAGVSAATLRRAARTGVWHPVALPPDDLGWMASEFRRLRPGGRVVMRLGVYLADKPKRVANDERGRHAVLGPPEWVAERLIEYVEEGCDGFVVNLGHETAGLVDRVRRFAAEVRPLVEASESALAG